MKLPHLLITLLLALLPLSHAVADDAQPVKYQMVYEGEFIDQAKKPLTGIFKLQFKLYQDKQSRKAMWSEDHFISVVNGHYEVVLGQQRSIPASAANKPLFLSVNINGREVLRQPIDLEVINTSSAGATLSTASYSEQCALSENSDRLGDLPAADYATDAELSQLEKRLEGGQKKKGGGARVSNKIQTIGPHGGKGGKAFELRCPKGQVVVGISGRSGAVIDSVGIICAPLE